MINVADLPPVLRKPIPARDAYGPHEAFREWCRESGVEPDPLLFGYFVSCLRLDLRHKFSTSLLDTTAFSFGGADGGGGIIVSTQGEDVPQIADCLHNVASQVHPLTDAEYFDMLHDEVSQPFPSAVIAEVPESGKPASVLVQGEVHDLITRRITERPHLSRNVGSICRMNEREYRELLQRREAHLRDWHIAKTS